MNTLAQMRAELQRQEDVIAALRAIAEDNPEIVLKFGDEIRERVAELLEPAPVRTAPSLLHLRF
jgi:hypothetical protein